MHEKNYVYLTRTLLQKLRNNLIRTFPGSQTISIQNLLKDWVRQQKALGEPPNAEQVLKILYTDIPVNCEYQLINGLCWIILDCPYRDYSYITLSESERLKLQQQFDRQFRQGTRIAWRNFNTQCNRHLDRLGAPPSEETIRQILSSSSGTNREYWSVDYLCQVLFNHPYTELQHQCSEINGLPLDNTAQVVVEPAIPVRQTTARIVQGTFSNPYDCWNPMDDSGFIGRVALLSRLEEALYKQHSVSIVGDWRIGKSSTLLTWLQRLQSQGRTAKLLSGEGKESVSLSAFVEKITEIESPATADGAANILSDWAETVGQAGLPPIILIDEVEGLIHNFEHRFFERLRGMLGQVILVIASRQPLHTLYEGLGRTSPFYNRLSQQWLGLLEIEAAEVLIQRGSSYLREHDFSLIREWVGRHPFYIQLMGWHLVNAYRNGDLIDNAIDRFFLEATPRLRELWRSLSEREQQALQDTVRNTPVNLRSLKFRGLIDETGQPFGRVLTEWLREEL